MNIHNMINIIIFGLIEGITELLPISSTGHLILISYALNIQKEQINLLEAFAQLGSSFSLLLLYRKKWFKILFFHKFTIKSLKKKYQYLTIFHIFISNLPSAILGILLHSYIKSLYSYNNVIFGIIFGTLFLLVTNIISIQKQKINNIKYMTYLDSLLIGFIQCLALWPGFSRSGATIAGLIFLGYNKSIAIEFSFMIGIPILIGASIVDIILFFHFSLLKNIYLYFIEFIVALIISLITIKKILLIVKNYSIYFFIIYRLILIYILYYIFFIH